MKNLSVESTSFIWHQMLIHVLKQIPRNQQSMEEMIDLCRRYYAYNPAQLKNIEKFARTYNPSQAIQRYTEANFLHQLLNRALRTEDIELLHAFAFYITDLYTAIENGSQQMKKDEILTLYRGARIPKEEFNKLKNNINSIISINGFFSTSKNHDVSLAYAGTTDPNSNFVAVLFHIKTDPSLKTVTFADIENATNNRGEEEEILFNLNSCFRINKVDGDETSNLCEVELIATNDGVDKFEEYIAMTNQQMGEYTPLIYFGRLQIFEFGQLKRAEIHFQTLLKLGLSDVDHVYNHLGIIYDERNEWNLALKCYKKAFKIRLGRRPLDYLHIARSLNNMAHIYRIKQNFDQASKCLFYALRIIEQTSAGHRIIVGVVMKNIGLINADTSNFDIALKYLSFARNTFQDVLIYCHYQITRCFGHIGDTYKKKGDFHTALDYYLQKLKMEEKYVSLDHPTLSLTLESIADTYKQLGEIDKGFELCKEKLIIQKERFGENHVSVARIRMIIAKLKKENNRNEALHIIESILQHCTPIDYETIGQCLTGMACINNDIPFYEEALQYYVNALYYKRQVFSSNHIEIAAGLKNIASCYQNMKNFSEARYYYNESLSIYRANFGAKHEDVKQIEEDMAALELSRKHFEE